MRTIKSYHGDRDLPTHGTVLQLAHQWRCCSSPTPVGGWRDQRHKPRSWGSPVVTLKSYHGSSTRQGMLRNAKKDLGTTPGPLHHTTLSPYYDQRNMNANSVTFRANTFPFILQELCHIIVYCDFKFRRFFLKCTHESIINIQIVIIMRAKQIKRGFVHECL